MPLCSYNTGRSVALVAGSVLAWVGNAAAQDATPVTATEVSEAPISREFSLSGTVTSPRTARVSSSIAGRVERMVVDAGDRLAAGDLILVLDSALEKASVAQARAALALAEEALADARRRLAEAEPLVAQKTFPETELKSRASEVRRGESTVDLRQAELRREEELLARHRVLAPFDGVVSRKLAEVGEWVEPGTAVAELVATEGLRVDFQAPQEAFARIGPDSRVRVALGSDPGRWMDADLLAAVPVSDAQARTFLLRVGLGESAGPVAPGMSANGRLLVDIGRRGLVLPRDALLRYPDGRIVAWVITAGGTVTERVLEVGVNFDGMVEVLGGVEAGERVVMRGNELLREGQAVVVREADDA